MASARMKQEQHQQGKSTAAATRAQRKRGWQYRNSKRRSERGAENYPSGWRNKKSFEKYAYGKLGNEAGAASATKEYGSGASGDGNAKIQSDARRQEPKAGV